MATETHFSTPARAGMALRQAVGLAVMGIVFLAGEIAIHLEELVDRATNLWPGSAPEW